MMTVPAIIPLSLAMNMLLVALAWIYVVLMVALAQAFAAGGSLLGALLTFVFWGLVPVALLLHVSGAFARRRRARRGAASRSAAAGDGCEHAASDAVAAEGEEARGVAGRAVATTADASHAVGGKALPRE